MCSLDRPAGICASVAYLTTDIWHARYSVYCQFYTKASAISEFQCYRSTRRISPIPGIREAVGLAHGVACHFCNINSSTVPWFEPFCVEPKTENNSDIYLHLFHILHYLNFKMLEFGLNYVTGHPEYTLFFKRTIL